MTRPKSNWAQIIGAICAGITVIVLLFGNPIKTSDSATTNSETKDQSKTKNREKLNDNAKLIEGNYKNSIDISGIWKCRPTDNPNSSKYNTMKITQSGKKITVKGIGQEWSGEGKFDGNEGYYDWKFSNGKTGRTKIYIDADGNLFGEVRGQITPWNYIGTR